MMGEISVMKFNRIKNPIRYALAYLQNKGAFDNLSDEKYCSIVVYSRCGYFVNYKYPRTFNEKIQWLKCYYRKPEFTDMVDKIKAKNIALEKSSELKVARIIKVYDSPRQIVLDELPDKFVVKCNHDGGVIICKNKSTFDLQQAIVLLEKRLEIDYYQHGREWPYKGIDRKVFVEEFLSDERCENLPVYKFLCFNGIPKIIQTIQNDKTPEESIDYFDTEWNLLELKQNYPNSKRPMQAPVKLNSMLEVAEQLSKGFPFLRVDLFTVDDDIYFSEFTFYSDAGFEPFNPKCWDIKLGNMIDLSLTGVKLC